MLPSLSTSLRTGAACLIAAAWTIGTDTAAWAQQPLITPVPGAPPAEAAAPASTAMTVPAMAGPLVANPNPMSFDGGPLGKVYLTGALTGIGLFQNDPGIPPIGDHHSRVDLSSGLVQLQNTEGMFQFFVQAGLYSFPALGAPYFQSWKATGDFFGPVPVAYAKIVPNDMVSVQVGKLPTLFGAEYGFTHQNMNIERGLLWAQEPIVSRGIQANLALGAVALSASLNDGFYSDSYNWLSGSAAWTIDKTQTLSFVGGGNFDHTSKNVFPKSPFFYNNSDIFNVIYTYSNAPWTITPYFQYTHVPGNAFLGSPKGASTYGGALLATYAINDNVNMSGRWEYISTSGSLASGAANLLYGPGSSAMSFTMTPTWQDGIYFLRADVSVVHAFNTTPGFVFGATGTADTQARFVIETGIMF
jgi:hypothetical protein